MNDRLEIHTLGNLTIYRGGIPVKGLASRKAEAALVYLAANPRPHPREVLAEMLWDERSQSQSLSNLRVVLSSLRKELGDIVEITRETAAIKPEAEVWLDTRELESKLNPLLQHRGASPVEILEAAEQAVKLYQGEFLEGVYLRECRILEEWIVRERERLHHKVVSAFGCLVMNAQENGAHQTGIEHCRQLLALDPLMEAGHRWMMRLLALSGQRGVAIAQYETCQHILWEELGVEPEAETTALYEQIMAGELSAAGQGHPVQPPELPDFLDQDIEEPPPPLLVAREAELARLEEILERALSGKGQMAFIAGEAGSGKTVLLRGFARQIQAKHPEALLALGECNAFSGQGDPYLPMRDLLQMLTGDLQSQLSAQAISLEQARRLWSALPVTVPALLEHGRDLLDTFVPARELARRLRQVAPLGSGWESWIAELEGWERPTPEALERTRLFEQFSAVLEEIAQQAPLLLLLDDMQWVDAGSISLLFHLARRLTRVPILILIAYRSEEIHRDRDKKPNPLEQALGEFKRRFGEVWVDLDASRQHQGRQFIEDLLDSEPNCLAPAFRQALFQRTGGHPLFTVELLRVLQEGGSLVQDKHGAWIEGPKLCWEVLPAKVDGAIQARLASLEAGNRDILRVASLMGEQFSLHVLASLTGEAERSLARTLGEELGRRRQLVQELGPVQIGGQRDYRFRFQHALFQQHLYQQVGETEREFLHRETGEIIERLYTNHTEEVTIELAHHFSEASEAEKASEYLLRAGDQARLLYAHQEAIGHYQRALAFLKEQGETERAARTLMKLGLTYHTIFDYQHSRSAYDEAFTLRQRAETTSPKAFKLAPHPFRIRWNLEPQTLDPTEAGDERTFDYIRNLFSGLVDVGVDYEIIPDVAHSWEISDDGCRYRFYMRDDVTWSDGEPVTAADFEYAWKHILDPANEAPQARASLLYDIKGASAYHLGDISDPSQVGVRAIDALTLEVEMARPASYFINLLTILYPVPRHMVEAHGQSWADPDNLVSNGPFLLKSYLPGESITLTRNPAYGRFPGNLEAIEIKFNLPRPEAVERYEANVADIVDLGPQTFSARHHHIEEYVSVYESSTTYVTLDSSRPPLDDLRVRQALVLAVDRFAGRMDSPNGGLVPPGILGHSPGIALPYDPDQACQLLAQAGYPDGRDFPDIQLDGTVYSKNWAERLIAQWRHHLNVEVKFVGTEWKEWKEYLERKHLDLTIGSWYADYPDPDNFLRVCMQIAMPYWRNESYNCLLDRARRTTNQEERIRLYQAADKFLIEEAIIMPLRYNITHGLVKPWVNVPTGWPFPWTWKYVIIEPH